MHQIVLPVSHISCDDVLPFRVGPGPLEKTDIDLAYWSGIGQNPPMEPTHCNTLADLPADRFSLLVYCCHCHRRPELDRTALSPGMTIPELRAHLVCSACGSRLKQLHIVWHGGGGSPYSTWGVEGEPMRDGVESLVDGDAGSMRGKTYGGGPHFGGAFLCATKGAAEDDE